MIVVGLSTKAISLWGHRKGYQACAKKKQHRLSSTMLHPLPLALGCPRAPGMYWKHGNIPGHRVVPTTPYAKERKLSHTRATKATFRAEAPCFPAPSDVWPGKLIFSHCRTKFCLPNYHPLPPLISEAADSQQKKPPQEQWCKMPQPWAVTCILFLLNLLNNTGIHSVP